ncbi:MAG TPA: peptidyl-prolyl cis-trans isomerase [Baekduia sp.]|nr:peptidyl-prolyl cis-trans isomerase [Baekduia sp.]
MPRRFLALIGAFFVLPLALSACGGGGVPGNAVVKIGNDTIKTATFDHWLKVAATSQAGQSGAKPQIPQPPDFTACVADKKKTAPKPAKGQPKPTDAQFKAQCQQQYNQLRDQVMQFLISSAWIEGESHDKGVSVSDQQVKKEFDQQRQQSFPKDTDYQKFLKDSGYVQEDLLYRIRVQDLSNKLRAKILEGTDKVTDADIAKYYNSHKKQFAQPERRDIRIILTNTEAKAKEAKQRVQNGEPFAKVAADMSQDQGTRDSGGLLSNVPQGQQEKALDDATFKAKKGVLSGPVKTQFGYYVFEVTKITPGSQTPLKDAKDQIKQLVISQRQQDKLNGFVKDFQSKWKDRTECRKGYVVAVCKNAPKSSTTAGSQPTATTSTNQ